MSQRALDTALVVLTAACTPALLLAGCGGDRAPSAATTQAAAQPVQAAAKPPAASRDTQGSRRALRAARRACQGKAPADVIADALPEARRRKASGALLALAEHPPAQLLKSPGYARAAGAVYAASLPVSRRADAARGCAYELDRVLLKQQAVTKSKSTIGTSR